MGRVFPRHDGRWPAVQQVVRLHEGHSAMKLRSAVHAHLECECGSSLENLIVQLEVRAGRKNPYLILFPATDASGRAELTKSDFLGQFKDHWERSLMDHDGTIEDAESAVTASLFDPSWALDNRSLALAWPLLRHERTKWATRESEYEWRTSCRNLLFTAPHTVVDLEHTSTVKLVLSRKESQGAI